MKRPLVIAAAGFAAGVFWIMHGGTVPLSWMVLLVMTAAGIALGIRFRRALPLLIAALAVLYGMQYANWYVDTIQKPVSGLDGESHLIHAEVLEYADLYADQQRVRIRIPKEELGTERNVTTLIYLPLSDHTLEPGDGIQVTADFYQPTYTQGFDRELYYRSSGIFILASAKEFQTEKNTPATYDLTITPESYPSIWNVPKRVAYQIRGHISEQFTQRQSAFLTALLLGDRSLLTTIDSNHLKKAGLSHVIAVSGLHIGFLISLLMLLLGRRIGSVLAVPTLIFFYLMVGWSPSVARAGIMYLFLILSFWLKREGSSLNALCLALLLILLYLPTSVDSVSLQLSFSATLGLILFSGRIRNALKPPKNLPFSWMRRGWSWITASVSCTLCTQIFTIPFLLHYFGYLSILSILTNLAALWAVSAVFALGCGFAVCCLIIPPGSSLFAALIAPLTNWIWFVADAAAGLPFGLLYSNRVLGILAVIVLYIMTVLLILRLRPKLTFPLGIVLLAVLCALDWKQSLSEVRISFLSVGYGQAAFVSGNDACVMIDCGGSSHHNAAEAALEYMDWNGIEEIDALVLTSVDKTHARNAAELLRSVEVGTVYLPAENRESETLTQLRDVLETDGITTVYYEDETPSCVGAPELGVTISGDIERKLMVRIQAGAEDILDVHAVTQNMLLDYLKTHTLQAKTLVVSAQFTEDYEEMAALLQQIAPEQIILGSGWESATRFEDVPVYNLYELGEWNCTVSEEGR